MVSILIVNWNTRDLLAACLGSIQSLPPSEAHEVIVVDNASIDGSAAMVRERFPSVKLIEADQNLGYAAGNNLAFGAASGDYLLTLNPDTEFTDNAMDRAIAALAAEAQAGALGARQIGPDGETQSSVRGFPSITGIVGDISGLGRRFPGGRLDSYRLSAFDYDRAQVAPQPMGTFLLFKRKALEAVGDPKAPFDPDFPIFFNEVDLLFRMKMAGWICLYDPEVRIKHFGAASTKQVRKSMIWESHRSLARYLWKHNRSPVKRIGLSAAVALILTAAFFRARGYHRGFRP